MELNCFNYLFINSAQFKITFKKTKCFCVHHLFTRKILNLNHQTIIVLHKDKNIRALLQKIEKNKLPLELQIKTLNISIKVMEFTKNNMIINQCTPLILKSLKENPNNRQ
jgi:hypothetical protein